MRLTQIALALTIILLGVTGWLAWQGQQEARGARQQLEFIKRQHDAQAAAGALPATPSVNIMPPPAPGQVAADAVIAAPKTPTPAAMPPAPTAALPLPPPAELTELQKRIAALPIIARVKSYEPNAGFVVISAGSAQRVSAGSKFDLRRENAVVGRITVGETIEESEAVADLDPASVPAGVTVEAGDEVIQVVNP